MIAETIASPMEDQAVADPGAGAEESAAKRPAGRVGRNIGALAGGQAITWTMTLLWMLIVPRTLGAAGLGLVVSALSVSGVLSIVLGMGTRNYLVREMVVAPDRAPELVGTAIVMRLLMAPVVMLAAVAYARLVGDGSEATIVLYLAAATTVLTLLAEPMQAMFQSIERMQYLAYADVINKSLQSVGGIGLVLAGFGAIAVTGDMAVSAAVVILVCFVWLRPWLRVRLRTSPRLMASMVRESAAYWTCGLFGMIYFWIDSVMLSLMTSSRVVGWYGAPMRLFQTLMFLPVMLSTAWLPRLVDAFTHGHDALLRAARKPVELILVLSAPIAGLVIIAAHPLVHYVYGGSFKQAVPVTVILALCVPAIYMNIMLGQVVLAAKRQVIWTYLTAGAAVFNPLLNLILIPATQHRYGNGAIGASVSLLVTESLMDVIGVFIVGRHIFDRASVRRSGLVVLATGAMCGVSYAATPLGWPASVAAGVATLAALTIVLRIATDAEVAMLRRGVAMVLGKLGLRRSLVADALAGETT